MPEATCPYCTWKHEIEKPGLAVCDKCGRQYEFYFFAPSARRPAAFSAGGANDAGALAAAKAEGGASGPGEGVRCANHQGNAAIAVCSRCGDFICGLCAIAVNGRIWCPRCFEYRLTKGDLAPPSPAANMARVALYMAIAGLLLAPCTLGVSSLFFGIGAIICGERAMKRAREKGSSEGRGAAVAAVTIGIIDIFLTLGAVVFFVIVFF